MCDTGASYFSRFSLEKSSKKVRFFKGFRNLNRYRTANPSAYRAKILLSVPASNLFIFSRCRIITISGIAVAAISNGHKLIKSQPGLRIIAKIKTSGKEIEAQIDARETYRHIKTTTTHIATANEAQIV